MISYPAQVNGVCQENVITLLEMFCEMDGARGGPTNEPQNNLAISCECCPLYELQLQITHVNAQVCILCNLIPSYSNTTSNT